MIMRLICWLNGGHDYTTIAWRGKVWSEKACLVCDKRKRNGHPAAAPDAWSAGGQVIPIGTLCILLRDRSGLSLGWQCTVKGHEAPKSGVNRQLNADHIISVPNIPSRSPDGHWAVPRSWLLPIAKPGDPDATPHDVSEPELLEVFR